MSRFKDFDLALAEAEPGEADEFRLGGETFTFHSPLPAGAVFQYVTEGAGARGLRYLAICIDFLAAIVDENPDPALADAVTAAEKNVQVAQTDNDTDAIAATTLELSNTQRALHASTGPARLREAIRTSKADLDFIDSMCAWVIEGGTSVPLPNAEPSSSAQSETGDGSKADSPSEASEVSSTDQPDGP